MSNNCIPNNKINPGAILPASGFIFVIELEEGTCPCGAAKIKVDIYIKPTSFPNSINVYGKGVLSVAILDTTEFVISTADLAIVTLGGVSPLCWSVEDVSKHFEPCFKGQMFHFRLYYFIKFDHTYYRNIKLEFREI